MLQFITVIKVVNKTFWNFLTKYQYCSGGQHCLLQSHRLTFLEASWF